MNEYEVAYTVFVTVEAEDSDSAEVQAFDILNELVGDKYLIVHKQTKEA